ncbi:glycoside hydrolase family 5 protein [Mixia osmundae IAM 14324]|uniref:mannan endo-1,4-beta-mannosidase n=1 Tax=Mixia osmundae (strain CBS 9802 / IAM 14324 / JCM 22182 / KY 12970) TaxID=764103 RepID=G7DWA3_MIXOS|nr:glycoside hydrolase family 5 protein [Mixia osmundae IAM 14324]KEI36509.1 glycoside hydrolase family 5 protein [Mixia osmundae IAM 14324]GAA94791.1 hypothetical protein E5Q_01445 [Mixia osmundae IAM 14324]
MAVFNPSAGCAAISAIGRSVIGSPSDLQRPYLVSSRDSFIVRNHSQLFLNGNRFRVAGPNIYWLGLDENVQPSPSYPTHARVLEVIATAATMGATTIRSTTLGVSVGNPLSVEPSLGNFSASAMDSIDFALYAARQYGLKVIIPLIDQYDYYHGGLPTFLRWRNLPSSKTSAFFDTSSLVFTDFKDYITYLLNHKSTYTNLTMAIDPTVLAFETGNELRGNADWTSQISQHIKLLAPSTLVIDGSYGVQKDALRIPTVDIHSNHFYPTMNKRLHSDLSLTTSAKKAYIAGEYEWNGKNDTLPYLFILVPVVLAATTLVLPARWFPKRIACGKRARRKSLLNPSKPVQGEYLNLSTPSQSKLDLSLDDTQPIELMDTLAARQSETSQREVLVHRWHLALLWLLTIPIGVGIVIAFRPNSVTSFTNALEQSDATGGLYWSLFGRDNDCCHYVEHNDGFTLTFPGQTKDMQTRLITLVKHAYSMSGLTPPFSNTVTGITQANLPVVSCSQSA